MIFFFKILDHPYITLIHGFHFIISLRKLFLYVHMPVCFYGVSYTCRCSWRQKRVSDSLKLEWQIVVSHQLRVLGTKPMVSIRAMQCSSLPLQPLIILFLINWNPPGIDMVNTEMCVPLLKRDRHLSEKGSVSLGSIHWVTSVIRACKRSTRYNPR